MSLPPLTDEERQALIDAAIKDEERRRKTEKRCRESVELNSDEAIHRRTDFDVFEVD